MYLTNVEVIDVVSLGGQVIGLIISTEGENRIPAWTRRGIDIQITRGMFLDLLIDHKVNYIIIHQIAYSEER